MPEVFYIFLPLQSYMKDFKTDEHCLLKNFPFKF